MSKVFYNAQNLVIGNGFLRNPDRYYLEEYFERLPALISFGTVTQATNHTTAVTLNASSGVITLAAAALAATTNVEFTLTNSFIKSTSVIMLTMQDENTQDNSQLACACHTVADGSCKITILNPHASNATSATASKIHFLVINGTGTLNNFNTNFMVSGTNATNSSVTFDANRAGILLTTGTTLSDNVIISPITISQQSPWNSIKWGTENQLEWECALSITDNTNLSVISGLQNTATGQFTDGTGVADGVYFTNDTTSIQWKVIVAISSSSTYARSLLPIAIENDTIYKFRITIDSSRFARVYVNDVQYSIATTIGGFLSSVTAGAVPSQELTNDIDLIPHVGIQTSNTTAKKLNIYYQKISRTLYE